jgi:CelD/BcsL family acetyltransferase involved in cellulose biosynthesis
MRISVVRPSELTAAELAQWRRMQHDSVYLQNPFLSCEFALAVDRIRDDAHVGVLEQDGKIVGFFPYQLRSRRVGGPIGAGLSDCQGIIHAPGLQWDPQALLRGCDLAVWEFDHLIADQAPFAPYHVVRERSPIMDLADGYEAYLAGRRRANKETVTTTFRKQRKMEREIGPVRFEFDVRDIHALEILMRWKSAQYRRTCRKDRFSRPWIVQLVSSLFATRTRECTATMSMLYAGDHPVAAHLGLRSQSVLSYWLPAYDIAFGTYSPGLLLCFLLAEAAAAQGVRHVDLGKGHMRYKESLKSRDLAIAEGWVERRSLTALVRRVQRAPRHHAARFILDRPALLDRARRMLQHMGRLRSTS